MEILPEVDEAAPPWNDAQSDVKPLKRGKCSDILVSGGRLVGDRRGGAEFAESSPYFAANRGGVQLTSVSSHGVGDGWT